MTINAPLPSQIPALRSLWKEAFGDSDEFLDTFFKTAFSFDRCRCITEGSTVLAALYWFDCIHEGRPIAYIYAVATATSHRGKGLCHTLMADTHLHLASLGYDGVLLVPGSQGLFHFYETCGYQTCTHLRKFECDANSDELLIIPITKKEYAKLRKILLPTGSIIQENENLDFLETQVNFYMGHGFLLTAYKNNDTLLGIELLGDTSMAPAIVHTFGCSNGFFRTPGNQIPFSMYHPLTETSLSPPVYFGFAFD